jgi:hypothetical protein
MTEGSKVWVITCPCGWSRMVPRSTPTERRLQILAQHRVDDHGEQEAES